MKDVRGTFDSILKWTLILLIVLDVEVILRDNVLIFRKWGVVKLVGSEKLESGVDKGDIREKKGRIKKKKTRETWTWNYDPFNFCLNLSRSIDYSFNL